MEHRISLEPVSALSKGEPGQHRSGKGLTTAGERCVGHRPFSLEDVPAKHWFMLQRGLQEASAAESTSVASGSTVPQKFILSSSSLLEVNCSQEEKVFKTTLVRCLKVEK